MFKHKKTFFAVLLAVLMVATTAFAHSGRTDSAGGHRDNKNVSGLGSYHYHHGYPAHLHPNGVCPYSSTSNSSNINTQANVISISYKTLYEEEIAKREVYVYLYKIETMANKLMSMAYLMPFSNTNNNIISKEQLNSNAVEYSNCICETADLIDELRVDELRDFADTNFRLLWRATSDLNSLSNAIYNYRTAYIKYVNVGDTGFITYYDTYKNNIINSNKELSDSVYECYMSLFDME